MKLRAVLADTGPLYAAADPDDSHHKRARQELQRLTRERYEVLVSYPTLLEAYSLVMFRLGKTAAQNWLGEMADAGLVNPSPEDYRQGASRVQSLLDQPVSLFDATVAALALRLGVDVWTYDHHFDLMRVGVWRSN
jgi:predicted nucleic acid-binding protein